MFISLLKISFIIFANLLAFLCIGLILDALFETDGLAILASVVVSLPILAIIMYFKIGGILQKLQNITEK